MSEDFSVWYRDTKETRKRPVRIETFGKTFMLFENQSRSETYYFGDLVYRGLEGRSQVFGLDDDIKARPQWRLGFSGDLPSEISALLPKTKEPMLSNGGMLAIAFLCLAIVHYGSQTV